MTQATKKKQRYVLEWFPIVQMLGDPDFYRECPYFLHLEQQGLETYQQVLGRKKQEEADQQPTKGCGSCSAKSIAGPALLAFVSHAGLLMARSQEQYGDGRLLEGIPRYLATKLDFVPSPVVLYYRSHEQKRERLEIG